MPPKILSKIYVKSILNIDHFQELLGMKRPTLELQQRPTQQHQRKHPMGELEQLIQNEAPNVKLVVIDSIGGLF